MSNTAEYRPVVEASYLDTLDIDTYQTLVELVCSKTHIYVILQNQPQPGNRDTSNGQNVQVFAPTEGAFTQIELIQVSEQALDDQIYTAIGLKNRNGPVFKSGALLVGADAIFRVDDSDYSIKEVIKLEKMEEEESKEEETKDAAMAEEGESEFKFIEAVYEIESSDSILIVFSDGSTWSVFENIQCEMIARRASKDKHKNLIGGQLI